MRTGLIFPILLTLLGCGYRPVGPREGPVAEVALGTVEDRTGEGDLGELAQRRIRATLAARERPRIVDNASFKLVGTVKKLPEKATGFDTSRTSTAYTFALELELMLLGPGDAVRWSSGPQRFEVVYLGGASVLEADANRRAALERAAQAGAQALTEQFALAPPLKEEGE